MKRIVSIVTALVMLLGLLAIDIPTSAEDAWVSIYANYIGSSSFDTEDTQSLLLVDLNVDGTPELLRMQMGGGMGETVMQPMTVSGSSIVTCRGSNAVYLGYLIQKISLNLYRKDNGFVWVIVVDCPPDSIGSDFIHKVFEISMKGMTVKSTGRFEVRGTEDGGHIYYKDGKKVSQSSYNTAYKSYFKKLVSMNMSATEGDMNAWSSASTERVNAFNAMVSRYRAALQAAIPVTKVSLNKTKISLAMGKTYSLKASVSPSYALNKAITWRSDNASVATVSGGTVKAVGYGTAKITATAPSGKYGTCTVTVPRPAATKVTIGASASSVAVGGSLQLTAVVSPSSANQTVSWTSSRKSVATVDARGLVKGVKSGKVEVTAKTSNGKHATKTIRVVALPPVGIRTSIAEGVFNFRNVASGLMLDVVGFGTADSTNVQAFTANSGNNQRWIVRSNGSGIYTLIPLHATGMALDVSSGTMQAGQNIQIYSQNQSAAQQFCFYRESNGNYTLRPNANVGLAVQAVGTVTGSNVVLGSYSAGDLRQQWSLVKVADVPAVNLQISGATMPTGNRTQGVSFGLWGIVTSNYPIDSVTAGVYTSSGAATAQIKTVYPSGTSCDIKTTLDSYIKFDQLSAGSYVYRVIATSCGVTKTLVESSFSIVPSSNDILLQSVYYQQEDDTGCYIATVAMIVANYDILCGRVPNTYATVKAANGGTTNFNWNTPEKLGLSDKDIFVTASSNISSDEKISKIIDGLHASPYGLFANFRDSAAKYSHVVVIIGYQNGNIIINDPARYGNGGERIKLTDSNYLTSHYKSTTGSSTATQAQMLTHLRVLTKFVPTT